MDRVRSVVCAAVAAARHIPGLGLGNLPKRFGGIVHAFDPRRIRGRPKDDKIVVHHGITLCSISFGHEFLLPLFGVDKDDVNIAIHAVPD